MQYIEINNPGSIPVNRLQFFIHEINQHIYNYNNQAHADVKLQILKQIQADIKKFDHHYSQMILASSNDYLNTHAKLFTAIQNEYISLNALPAKSTVLSALIANISYDKGNWLLYYLMTSPTVQALEANLNKLYDLNDSSPEANYFRNFLNTHQITVLGIQGPNIVGNSRNLLIKNSQTNEQRVLRVESTPGELDQSAPGPKIDDELRNNFSANFDQIEEERYFVFARNNTLVRRAMVVTEYFPNGDLYNFSRTISQDKKLELVCDHFGQLIELLINMQKHNILFPDSKLNNILLRSNGSLAVADTKAFEYFSQGHLTSLPTITSLSHYPPEMSDANLHAISTPDSFHSFIVGINLHQYLSPENNLHDYLTNNFAVYDQGNRQSIPKLRYNDPIFNIQGNFKDLIDDLTKYNPQDRISLSDALNRIFALNPNYIPTLTKLRSISANPQLQQFIDGQEWFIAQKQTLAEKKEALNNLNSLLEFRYKLPQDTNPDQFANFIVQFVANGTFPNDNLYEKMAGEIFLFQDIETATKIYQSLEAIGFIFNNDFITKILNAYQNPQMQDQIITQLTIIDPYKAALQAFLSPDVEKAKKIYQSIKTHWIIDNQFITNLLNTYNHPQTQQKILDQLTIVDPMQAAFYEIRDVKKSLQDIRLDFIFELLSKYPNLQQENLPFNYFTSTDAPVTLTLVESLIAFTASQKNSELFKKIFQLTQNNINVKKITSILINSAELEQWITEQVSQLDPYQRAVTEIHGKYFRDINVEFMLQHLINNPSLQKTRFPFNYPTQTGDLVNLTFLELFIASVATQNKAELFNHLLLRVENNINTKKIASIFPNPEAFEQWIVEQQRNIPAQKEQQTTIHNNTIQEVEQAPPPVDQQAAKSSIEQALSKIDSKEVDFSPCKNFSDLETHQKQLLAELDAIRQELSEAYETLNILSHEGIEKAIATKKSIIIVSHQNRLKEHSQKIINQIDTIDKEAIATNLTATKIAEESDKLLKQLDKLQKDKDFEITANYNLKALSKMDAKKELIYQNATARILEVINFDGNLQKLKIQLDKMEPKGSNYLSARAQLWDVTDELSTLENNFKLLKTGSIKDSLKIFKNNCTGTIENPERNKILEGHREIRGMLKAFLIKVFSTFSTSFAKQYGQFANTKTSNLMEGFKNDLENTRVNNP